MLNLFHESALFIINIKKLTDFGDYKMPKKFTTYKSKNKYMRDNAIYMYIQTFSVKW